MRNIVVGIDIGGTNSPFSILDETGYALAVNHNISTNEYDDVEKFVEAMHFEITRSMQQVAEPLNLCGIGIGAPNGNYYTGSIEFAPNLRWQGIIPLAELFKKYFEVPVYLTNDANAAAIGEMVFGGAKNMKDFIVITLGTGLGSGLVANGELVYGHDAFAGELGHTIVVRDGRHCKCGRQGCLETYVSATGIKRTAFEMMANLFNDSKLRSIPYNDLTSEQISIAALQGDVVALESFEYTGKLLGEKLAEAVAYTSPEAIFLFGGLAKAGDLIFNPTRFHLEKNLLNIYKNKVKLLPSGLPNANAAVLGASALVWSKIAK